MTLHKERDYYKATRRAIAVLNSSSSLKEKLATIVKGVARTTGFGASIVLLDVTGKKLVHTTYSRLPQFYVRKGILDAEKSLAEIVAAKPVIIPDTRTDGRIQYPEVTARAGIVSILGVPIASSGSIMGSLRVYTRERYDFSNRDISFVTAMADIVAVALTRGDLSGPEAEAPAGVTRLEQAQPVTFAHPSEAEFARLLDFYNIEWVYEPRSFLLKKEGERVTEMFTPDFYLPALDLYVELTTMKQSLVSRKKQKLRRLRELFPDVKVTLLYRRDYDRLLAKYGCGPLAQTRAHGISRVLYSAAEIEERVRAIAGGVSRDYAGRRPILVGIQRGFLCFMADLIRQITVPLDVDFMAISYYSGGGRGTVKITKDMDVDIAGRNVIVIEDIVDTGMTLNFILNHLKARGPASLAVCTLLDRRVRRLIDITLDYIGFEIPDEFAVGYGLDYREEYRNLPFIGVPRIEGPSGEDFRALGQSLAGDKKRPG